MCLLRAVVSKQSYTTCQASYNRTFRLRSHSEGYKFPFFYPIFTGIGFEPVSGCAANAGNGLPTLFARDFPRWAGPFCQPQEVFRLAGEVVHPIWGMPERLFQHGVGAAARGGAAHWPGQAPVGRRAPPPRLGWRRTRQGQPLLDFGGDAGGGTSTGWPGAWPAGQNRGRIYF